MLGDPWAVGALEPLACKEARALPPPSSPGSLPLPKAPCRAAATAPAAPCGHEYSLTLCAPHRVQAVLRALLALLRRLLRVGGALPAARLSLSSVGGAAALLRGRGAAGCGAAARGAWLRERGSDASSSESEEGSESGDGDAGAGAG
jgi:hypothetical protein